MKCEVSAVKWCFQMFCEPVTTESEGSGRRIFYFYFSTYCHVHGRFLPMRSLLKTARELLECNLSWRVSQMEYFASVRLCELSPSSRIQTVVMNNEKYWRSNVPWCAFRGNVLENSSAMFLSQKSEREPLLNAKKNFIHFAISWLKKVHPLLLLGF